jgi:hypothetical protein
VTAHLAVCGVGAALAMAGHFPRRPRSWVPHAVTLLAMVLACLPGTGRLGLPLALAALAGVLGWQLWALPSVRERCAECSDTLAMAALIALTAAVPAVAGTAVHSAAMHSAAVHSAAGGDRLQIALAVLACWLLVRVCTRLAAAAPPGRRVRAPGDVARSCGGLLMLAGMTTMVA